MAGRGMGEKGRGREGRRERKLLQRSAQEEMTHSGPGEGIDVAEEKSAVGVRWGGRW